MANETTSKIPIKNIYYMLCYALRVIKPIGYEYVEKEDFKSVQDLFAEILTQEMKQQIKKGLYREYIVQHESLSVIRGKIDITETIRNKIQRKQRIACEFDEFSENNLLNQIIKTAMWYLVQDDNVDEKRKPELKKVLLFLSEVDLLDPSLINWSGIQYHRHNQSYKVMIIFCKFMFESMLMVQNKEGKGKYKIQAFTDEQMAKLYEKFILEYYKRHFPFLNVSSPKINWKLDEGKNKDTPPEMRSDVMLTYNNNVLVIDAKYYGKNTTEHYGKESVHSGNLYQIFTYVKNEQLDERSKNKENKKVVSGLLLYAETVTTEENGAERNNQIHVRYSMSGNIIGAETLNLNCDFNEIKGQLNAIAEEFFSDPKKKDKG